MKHIKLFETFSSINENSSDDHISDVLAKLDITYKIGKDVAGNEGVFITDEKEGSGYPVKFEIYSSHPEKEHSTYHITYYTRGYSDYFNTTELESSLQDILDLE